MLSFWVIEHDVLLGHLYRVLLQTIRWNFRLALARFTQFFLPSRHWVLDWIPLGVTRLRVLLSQCTPFLRLYLTLLMRGCLQLRLILDLDLVSSSIAGWLAFTLDAAVMSFLMSSLPSLLLLLLLFPQFLVNNGLRVYGEIISIKTCIFMWFLLLDRPVFFFYLLGTIRCSRSGVFRCFARQATHIWRWCFA